MNVLLHAAVCWMVVVLAYALFHAHFPSLVSGLLFAVHPIHTGEFKRSQTYDSVCDV